MIDPTWGLKGVIPDDAQAWWGARAILRNGELDFLWDRQSAGGDDTMRRRMHELLQGKWADWLRNEVRTLTKRGELNSGERQRFVRYAHGIDVAFDTHASHGYLYIAAWISAPSSAQE